MLDLNAVFADIEAQVSVDAHVLVSDPDEHEERMARPGMKARRSQRHCREFLFALAQGSFIENDFHQMRSHIVKLCLKIFIVTGEFCPERRQVYRTLYLVQ